MSGAEKSYRRLAPIYDVIYGTLLQPGRRRAMARLAPRPGDWILEIGVGTGFSLSEYPAGCHVVAIDLSEPMIKRARARIERQRIGHVSICRMDAGSLAFPDERFDAVYAPYVINVVPHPARAAREMLRVCREGGRIVLLNHFDRVETARSRTHRVIGRVASRIAAVNWRLDFHEFIRESRLVPQSIEAVNLGGVSSVVVCVKPCARPGRPVR
jgi:phosphatidylethanolamine/phosphatidyl-N-methylethanolamine N-methyltransferase